MAAVLPLLVPTTLTRALRAAHPHGPGRRSGALLHRYAVGSAWSRAACVQASEIGSGRPMKISSRSLTAAVRAVACRPKFRPVSVCLLLPCMVKSAAGRHDASLAAICSTACRHALASFPRPPRSAILAAAM